MLSGIFGTGAILQTDINLILQVTTLLIVAISLVYKNRLNFKMHGVLMGIAVVLHVISFFAVMGPSFSSASEYFMTATSELGVITMWIHAIPGAIAMILGIVLVTSWALQPSNLASCARRKRLMDITVLSWLVSLIFGIATYVVFYV